MDEAYGRFAELILHRASNSDTAGALVTGSVISWPSELRPMASKRIQADGNVQDEDSLLVSASLDSSALVVGDTVLLAAVEERQKYIILCKVVSV